MLYLQRTSMVNWIACALTASALLLTAPGASAQSYEEMKATVKEADGKQLRPKIAAILRNSQSLSDAQKKQMVDYFMGYYFPRMTRTDAESLGRLAEDRKKFFQQYLNLTKSQSVRNDMVKMTMSRMGKIALGNYHPAGRYNAILLIGMLDEIPATVGANPKPPTPLPAGTNALIAVLTRPEISGVKVPTSAKVGALVGLERHARFGIDEKHAAEVTKAALALIAQQEPGEDVSEAVHHWMKCQAARVLVNQYAKGPNSDVQLALNGLIADGEMSLDDRCCAAQLLKKLEYGAAADLNVDETTTVLGELAKTVLTKESKAAKDFQDELYEGGGALSGRGRSSEFGEYSGAFSPRGGVDEGPRLEKRRMLARMKAIVDGAQSIAEKSPDVKAKLDPLREPIEKVIASATKKNAIDVNIARDVIELGNQVALVVDSWQPAAEAPAEEPAPEEAFN